MPNSRLIPISYYDPNHEIRLSAYADIIIYEPGAFPILRGIRFGGYPEMVQAMYDAIFGGATIEARIGDKSYRFTSEIKRYVRQINHDGVYAEATLLGRDDDQEIMQSDDNSQTVKTEATERNEKQEIIDAPPRRCMLFCPAGDKERLFEELDRKTSVPLIPEFRDYLLAELEDRGILQKLNVITIREQLEAWMLQCTSDDANIISAVEDGLKSGAIRIPGTVRDPDGLDCVNNVTGYLNAFGVVVAERIRNQFEPLFDPAADPLSPEILAINDYIQKHAGYPLFDAQLAVAESVKRQLAKDKFAFIVAECGSGKTKIGSTAMTAVISASAGAKGEVNWRKTFNIILCPSHVAKKWVREIAETLPETVGMIVRNPAELDRLYAIYEQSDKSVYAVISKENARDGYMKRPAVIWNERKKAFVCPDCQESIMNNALEKVSQLFFKTETKKNHKCDNCGSLLWTAVNPGERSDWVKIGNYGWVFRHRVCEHFRETKNAVVLEKLNEIQAHPDWTFAPTGACRSYPLSSYIKRMYKGRIDGAIFDELHQYNNNSGQGDAMGDIFSAAKKVIGMTATLINGYASGIFHLLYRTMPSQMLLDGKPYKTPEVFNREYGVKENRYTVTFTGNENNAGYAANRRTVVSRSSVKQLPGVSPLVYSRFLLEKTAFLSLSDMGKTLPDYEEIPIALKMSAEVEKEYMHLQKALGRLLKNDRRMAVRLLSTYLNLLTVFPDQPYDQPPVLHPETGSVLLTPQNAGSFDQLGEKEKAVLDIVQRKVSAGEKVLVYTSWIRTDTQKKLMKLLSENGYRTEIMNESIQPGAREDWVKKRLASGMQVLITNPSLVETGLDLNAFTTLVFYSLGYKLFTLRQASRRSWRINQTAPKVEVYLLYYQDTAQQKAMKLMASKLATAGIIEGNFSEEGLAAMSDMRDMTSQLAKELMLGIKDNVEDIAASFKKMAIINPDRRKPAEILIEEVEPVPPAREDKPRTVVDVTAANPIIDQEKIARFAALLEFENNRKSSRRKPVIDENQLSLFDVA